MVVLCSAGMQNLLAQEQLDSVTVTAFSSNARLRELAAAAGLVTEKDWQKFSPASALSGVNSQPGVRMEERSPGSYRFAMRGSSLRSPFGVRNVRFYLEGVPFTDPGGNTYLNALPPAFLGRMELLRGPAGSHYGAGTGGVVLASQLPDTAAGRMLALQYTAGSYGLHQVDLDAAIGSGNWTNRIQYHHQQADGYRRQSAMRRDALSWQAVNGKGFRLRMIYSDLWYQTPGGLTLAQYQENPRQARPASGPFPSAEEARAAIRQKLFFLGACQQWQLNPQWTLDLSGYGAFTQVENPSIRNLEKRSEPHAGLRLYSAYTLPLENGYLRFSAGGEYQAGAFQVDVYGNRNGAADTIQTLDAVHPQNAFFFGRLEWAPAPGWKLGAELSWNRNQVSITRESLTPNLLFQTHYQGEWAPRFSLLKTWKNFSAYVVAARGFSPPGTQELLPSNNVINTNLQAEYGWNTELGLRGPLLHRKGWIEMNVFYFRLQDAIVQKRDAGGADYFDNAGGAEQKGFETSLRYPLLQDSRFRLQPWISYTLYSFRYRDYKPVDEDFSGNAVPGVARQVLNAGLDLSFSPRASFFITYQYSDPIWLNDANTAKAAPFHLLGARANITLLKSLQLFAGVDNLLNTVYSLGNDINAAGARYYNAAAGRNYYGGLRFSLSSRRYQGSEEANSRD